MLNYSAAKTIVVFEAPQKFSNQVDVIGHNIMRLISLNYVNKWTSYTDLRTDCSHIWTLLHMLY